MILLTGGPIAIASFVLSWGLRPSKNKEELYDYDEENTENKTDIES